jgi:hypothetical protein
MTDTSLREIEREFLHFPSPEAAHALWYLRQRAGLPIWNMPVLPRSEPEGADHHMALELFDYVWSDGPIVPRHLNIGRHGGPAFPHDFLGQVAAIEANLVKKIKSKKRPYSYTLAEKIWVYLADNAARAYNLTHRGQITLRGIDKATRLATARLLATDFERRVNENNLSVDRD